MNQELVQTLVVMPVWNGDPFLREAICSILDQTGCPFHFLVVDDGSTDRTPEILGAFTDSRMQVHTQAHCGLIATMNYAISYANANGYKYLVRMDADDVSLPGRVKTLVECLETTSADAASSNCRYIDEYGQEVGSSTVACNPRWVRWEIHQGLRGLIQGAAIFRVSALVAAGGYRDSFVVAEDTDMFLRLSENGILTNVKTYLYNIRQTSGSRSRSDFRKNLLYSNYALDCARHRRRGIKERSLDAFGERSLLWTLPQLVEWSSMRIWNWSQGGPGRKWAMPVAALLSPYRCLSRFARWFL